MNETITVLRVPTGLSVPAAMQEAQDRLLARFGDAPPQVAVNLQEVIDNPDIAILFAVAGNPPVSSDDWQALSADLYAGTVTMALYTTTTHKAAHVDDVIVDEQYEGRGVGKMLMYKAIEIARENHVLQRLSLKERQHSFCMKKLVLRSA